MAAELSLVSERNSPGVCVDHGKLVRPSRRTPTGFAHGSVQ
jgi:hypothetical protein